MKTLKQLVLTLFMAAVFLSFCKPEYAAASESASQTAKEGSSSESISTSFLKEDSAKARMTNDLAGYICVSETMYVDILWALDYFEKFDGEKSWDNLQFARAALSIARRKIEALQFPDQKMSYADHKELKKLGADMSFLEVAEDAFEGERITFKNTCVNLNYGIMEDVFLEDDWKICKKHAGMIRKIIDNDLQYLANTADWVLASLNDEAFNRKFYAVMENNCPMTRARQASVLDTPEKIEEKTNILLDTIQKTNHEEDEIIGAHRNRKNVMEELLKQDNYTAIGENLTEISGMPHVLSYPTWYDIQNIHYYWKENGEVSPMPDPGTVLKRIPDGCMITINNVAKTDVLDYQGELEEAGLSCSGSTDDNGELFILYEYDESTFAIKWENNAVTILMTEKPFCFVPNWYLPAKKAVK